MIINNENTLNKSGVRCSWWRKEKWWKQNWMWSNYR